VEGRSAQILGGTIKDGCARDSGSCQPLKS
jgi:hypothetical protein